MEETIWQKFPYSQRSEKSEHYLDEYFTNVPLDTLNRNNNNNNNNFASVSDIKIENEGTKYFFSPCNLCSKIFSWLNPFIDDSSEIHNPQDLNIVVNQPRLAELTLKNNSNNNNNNDLSLGSNTSATTTFNTTRKLLKIGEKEKNNLLSNLNGSNYNDLSLVSSTFSIKDLDLQELDTSIMGSIILTNNLSSSCIYATTSTMKTDSISSITSHST